VIVCSCRSTLIRPAPRGGLNLRSESIDNLLVDNNRQDTVLKAVGEKNIAEARADDGPHAHLLQRPHRPFAGRAAAEIRTGDEDFRLTIGLAVQDELGILRTIR
jgi:hypothetical protein